MMWSTVNTNFDQSLYFNAYDNTLSGDEAWLVSPSLDLSAVPEASVFFDMSCRNRLLNDGNEKVANDSFQLILSTDCGNTYSTVLWERSGASWQQRVCQVSGCLRVHPIGADTSSTLVNMWDMRMFVLHL
jgi:hypothetical protein